MAYLTGEARAQLDAFKAVTVKHAHLQEVDEKMSLIVEEHTDATHVLLCGPGVVGKSKVLEVVAERFTREELDRFVVPIVLACANPVGYRTLSPAGLLSADRQGAQRTHPGQRNPGERRPPHGLAQSNTFKIWRYRLAGSA